VFTVTSNTAWTVTDDADWLTISPSSGSGNGTITATYTSNDQPIQRIGNINISGTDVNSQKVTVTQDPFYKLIVNPETIMLDACAYNAQQISIQSNTNWTINTNPDGWWLTVSPITGTGDGVITVSAYDNIDYSVREAILIVALPDGNSKIISIMQSGGTWVFVEPSIQNVEAVAGKTSFTTNILSGGWVTYCAEVYENVEWISVESISICGYQEVSVFYTANELSQKRTGEICFFPPCGGVGMCVTITQNGAPVQMDITPVTIQLGYQEGSGVNLNITSSIEWSATTPESWLTLSQNSGIGNREISVTAKANTSLTGRNTNITFTGVGVENKVVTVTQQGSPPFLETSASLLPLSSAEGSSGTFDITSNTNWTAVSSEGWLSISNTGAFGNATITVTAQKNPTINTRNAAVTIKANDLSDKTVILSQTGSPTGIDEVNNCPIRIYPNPAENSLKFEGINEDYQLFIYNQSGRLVIKSLLRGNHFDITSLNPGIYTIMLWDENERYTFKFVKD